MNATSRSAAEDPFVRLNGARGECVYEAWLECVTRVLGDVRHAVLVMGTANVGPWQPVAFWPQAHPPSDRLAAACEQVLEFHSPVASAAAEGAVLAYPVSDGVDLLGVAGVEFALTAVPSAARDWLRWGMGWLLQSKALQAGSGQDDELRERLLTSLNLMMGMLTEPRWQAAAQALVTEMAVRLGCDRLSVGVGDEQRISLAALSHSADFSRRMDLARDIEAAMHESLDQHATICCDRGLAASDPGEEGAAPEPGPRSPLLIRTEHKRLAENHGNRVVLSAPFALEEEGAGVFLFEWSEEEVDEQRLELAQGLAPVLGRLLLERRALQLPWYRRLKRGGRALLGKLVGATHVKLKLILLVILSSLLFLFFAEGRFEVTADAVIEGGVRRMVVAPFDGFVAEAKLRAGHRVEEGETLAVLDDRDLKLEVSRWQSQQRQYAKQLQDAQAQQNLAQMQITRAQLQQAQANLSLAQLKLKRSQVTAPFAGLVVAGDLSQHLGAAIRKGQTLFEIAPLDSYRVVLQVEEGEISHLQVGQQGRLVVAALPRETLPFRITLITPVADAREGSNFFRVEAQLLSDDPRILPGMEGVGKVDAGERKLAWIWTHRLAGWLRLKAWGLLGI